MWNRKMKGIAVGLALITLLSSCGKHTDADNNTDTSAPEISDTTTLPDTYTTDGDTETQVPVTEPTALNIVQNGKTSFKVIYSSSASNEIGVAAVQLRRAINEATGANVGVTIDKAPATSSREILIGSTNREASKAFQDTLSGYSFGIKITDEQVIIAATHEDFIPLAVEYFMKNYLTDSDLVDIEKGTYSILSSASVICSGKRADIEKISIEREYATITELHGQIPKSGNFKILQGGCVTDKYAYMAVINTADYDEKAAGCYIYKYDLKTWKLVRRSKVLMLDHANDITYNPNNNMLYVAHCYVDSKKISLIDADTLELKSSIFSDTFGVYAFDYEPTNNIFVGGNGKSNTVLYKGTLNGNKLITTGRIAGITTQMITQGICCDANYVYHVMFTTGNPAEPYNAIFVYDLKTKQLANNIRLSISGQEPENISLVNGEFYIGCNSNTTKLDLYKSVLYEFEFDDCVPCP